MEKQESCTQQKQRKERQHLWQTHVIVYEWGKLSGEKEEKKGKREGGNK